MTKKNTSIKLLSLLVTLFFTVGFGYGQTTLSAGDIAITGFNSDDPKGFTFVLLTEIETSTEIKFSDEGWLTSGGFRGTGEGWINWTANSNISCGTEIIITNLTGNIYTSNFGTAIESGLGFDLSASGDQILAYQGDESSPVFIYAINFDGDGWSDATGANNSALPTGLTDGVNAVDVGEIDNGTYNCDVTSDTTLILAGVSNVSNWTLDNAIISIGGCYYSCEACSGGTVTWNGTWSGTPDLTTQVIIDANYSIGNSVDEISFSACSLKVNAGFNLTVSNGEYVEVENDVTVDGQLFVQTQGNFVQNSDTASFTDNTTNGVVLSKDKTSEAWYSYTYWSSPVEDETIEGALGFTPVDRRFEFIAANFIDVLVEIGNTNTFTSGSDDIDDNGNDWQHATGLMTPGVGYAATAGEFAPFFPITETFNFYGAFNNGEILVPIINNSGGLYNDWNFIGNPYPGAISADTFFTVNTGLVDVIYLWDQGTPPSSTNSGNEGSNFSSDDYAMINGTGTTAGARGDTGLPPNRYVPSGQGFFVEALTGGNVIFNNSMRSITADNSQFFKVANKKDKTSSTNNGIWINLTSDNGVFGQVMIGYINGATNGNDGAFYDAPKNTATGAAAILYTTIEGSNKVFAIQGKAASSLDENEVIKLGFDTSINVATIYTLSIPKLEGDFLTNNPVYLRDNLTGTVHDLSGSDYSFTSEVGEFKDRFEIVFTPQALSTNNFEADAKGLQIFQVDDTHVRFAVTHDATIKSVRIFDLLGRELYQLKGSHSEETYNLSNLNNSVFIAKVELSNGMLITKKAIKK